MAAAGAAPRRSRIGTVAVALLVLTLGSAGLAACGSAGGNPYGLADFQSGTGSTGSPGATAAGSPAGTAGAGAATGASAGPGGSSSATPGTTSTTAAGPQITIRKAPAGMVTYSPSDVFEEGAWVERGTITGATGPQKVVADAVLAYLSARAEMSNTWIVDNRALSAVASGQALTSAITRAEAQRAADRHSVGKFVLNLSSITITGDAAVVSGCPFDATVEVSALGSLLTDAAGGVQLRLNLERTSGRWRVVTFPATVTFCTEPAR